MNENRQNQFMISDELIASTSQRFLNWVIDVVIQILIFVISFSVIANIAHSYGNKELPSYLLVNPIGQYTFVSIIRLIYYISLETLFAQSLGKMLTQTMVVDENGERPSHNVVLIRTLCRLIPFYEVSFFGMPCIGWHDRLSKTFVVNKKQLEEKQQHFRSLKKTAHDHN
jgi:uncharacterized RDD family membrane protein YckC